MRRNINSKDKIEELTTRARLGSLATEFKELIDTITGDMRQEIYQEIESANEQQLLTLKARLQNIRVLEGKLNAIIQAGKSAQDKVLNNKEC